MISIWYFNPLWQRVKPLGIAKWQICCYIENKNMPCEIMLTDFFWSLEKISPTKVYLNINRERNSENKYQKSNEGSLYRKWLALKGRTTSNPAKEQFLPFCFFLWVHLQEADRHLGFWGDGQENRFMKLSLLYKLTKCI